MVIVVVFVLEFGILQEDPTIKVQITDTVYIETGLGWGFRASIVQGNFELKGISIGACGQGELFRTQNLANIRRWENYLS